MNKTQIHVTELRSSLKQFDFVDYLVMAAMLAGCGIIGIYYGFIEKRKQSRRRKGKATIESEYDESRRASIAEEDYLVGGRKMQTIPIAISLIATWVSGIALLGTSTEVYLYGAYYAYMGLSLALSGIIVWFVYLPVFHGLQLTSTYEYLELRFSKGVRRFGSVLFCFNMTMWLPIVIFVPALAFNQLTGVNIHIITPIVCGVCIFYTCIGGIKAVVWTDVLQAAIMMSAVIAIMIKGTAEIGGFDIVWQRNLESGRLDFPDFTVDPTVRYSIFSIFGGGFIYWIQSSTCNQTMMQRYSALPTLRNARFALIIFIIGLVALLLCCVYNGMLIYATYYDCDPLTTKLVKAKDQLTSLIVMDVMGNIPGFPGFFITGVLCAALSSLSTGLNSLTAVILEDFWKPMLSRPMSERQTKIFMRLISVVFGLICVALVYVVEQMGAVLQLSSTLSAISHGPECGLYMIGLFMPWINRKSALTGAIVSICMMFYICFRSQLSVASGEYKWPEKPVQVDGCEYNFTMPEIAILATLPEKAKLGGFRPISHYFFVALGSILTVVVAVISSFFYGSLDPRDVDTRLLAPFVRKFIKSRKYLSVQPDVKEREAVIHAFEIHESNLNS